MDEHMIEKELNVMLIDHLASLERLEIIAKKKNDEELLKAIEIEKNVVNRKLYSAPPLQK